MYPQSNESESGAPEIFSAYDGKTNENPSDITFWELLKEDYRTHDSRFSEPGFWAVAVHRLGNWRMSIRSSILRAPFTLIYKLLFTLIDWFWGIMLPYNAKLGRRVRIWHHGGIVISARSIGSDVHIRHNTTLGVVRTGDNQNKPIIEDHVDIGCGACILGGIKIGHHSTIGANAVVVRNVPPYSVAGGVPAKIIKSCASSPDISNSSP
jgi:serine O-acetyltransferase